jgi:hypothetical protein
MRIANLKNTLVAYVFLSVIVCPAAGNIIYVNEDATGSNNGTSWQNAYTDLQSALSRAVKYDDIWVAAGTYKPGTFPNDSFCMENGVGIYGGFPDSGDPNIADRDWHSNPTILRRLAQQPNHPERRYWCRGIQPGQLPACFLSSQRDESGRQRCP